jgi:hypothetical protein
MMRIVKFHWPVILAIAVLWITVAVLLGVCIERNQGHITYALDDPYIHMAIAKNFSQHGVWGVTKYGFSSSSSSLLWTLLLSFYYLLFGISETAPLIMNLVLATFMVFLVYIILKRSTLPPLYIFLILLSMIFLTPIPLLIFCGLEHVLHTLISIAFIYFSAKILSNEHLSQYKNASLYSISLLLLSPLVIMARYEGAFLVFTVCFLFFVRKRLTYAVLLGGLGVLPIAIFGLISVSKGWYFFPNSVLLKKHTFDFTSLEGIIKALGRSIYQIAQHEDILGLTIGALIVFYFLCRKHRDIWTNSIVMNIILVATIFLHMHFAEIGWLYRYESYLFGLGVFVIGLSLGDFLSKGHRSKAEGGSIPQRIALTLLILVLISPCVRREVASLKDIPNSTTELFSQQYQMGLFLREYYQGYAVATHDIGAINYLADVRCLDLWGLANMDAAKLKRSGRYNRYHIDALTKSQGISLAIVADKWFEKGNIGGLPSHWVKCGNWVASTTIEKGEPPFSFYAVEPKEAENLLDNLRIFSSHLPKTTVQSGEYLNVK